MLITNKKLLVGIFIILISLVYGYIFFEKFLTEKEITITVLNSAQFGNEPGKYLIFTKDEVFEDADNYYHEKNNAEEIFQKLRKGKTYKVKVVSFYWPLLPHFRNILDITEENLPAQIVQ